MKQHLDEASINLKQAEYDKKITSNKLRDAEEEVAYFKRKHDEMF